MKLSYLSFSILCLLKTQSFAMFFEEPLMETSGLHGVCKDVALGDNGYKGRSQIYNLDYPTMPMVHSYNQEGRGGDDAPGVPSPFSASIPIDVAHPPQVFNEFQLQSYPKRAFFFVVQGIEKGRKLTKPEIDIINKHESNTPLVPAKERIFSSVQRYYVDNDGHHLLPHYSLKPQYLLHPDTPMLCTAQEASRLKLNHTVSWAVVPGAEGKVVSERGSGLLSDKVSTHRQGPTLVPMIPKVKLSDLETKNPKEYERVTAIMEKKGILVDSNGCVDMDEINDTPLAQRMKMKAAAAKVQPDELGRVNLHAIEGAPFKDDLMILSGDVMHLSGISPLKSVDSYDLVASDDLAAVTYRWQLADTDLVAFNKVLEGVNSLRVLIEALEKENSFRDLLDELKKYLGLLPRKEMQIEPTLPVWNSNLEIDVNQTVPRGWKPYAVNSELAPTVLSSTVNGQIKISGKRNFGVHTLPLDLSSFVGKKIRFSALIKAPISGFIEFWGRHEKDRTNFSPSTEWQNVSVETVIDTGNTSQKLYIGSLGEGEVEFKNLKLELVSS